MASLPLRSALIRLAATNPDLRRHLLPILAGERVASVNLSDMGPGDSQTFAAAGVYVHVWFDVGVAKTDFGNHVPDSGEWQVIVSTSEDRLNLHPRGRELARKEFRYAEPRARELVLSAAQDYVRSSLFRFRGKVADA